MTCLETLVDFRGKINAMHLGKSPWIEPGLEEQCILIDWGALFMRCSVLEGSPILPFRPVDDGLRGANRRQVFGFDSVVL
jgi:hypothetical protein